MYSNNKGNYNFYGSRDYLTNGTFNFDYAVQNQLNDHSKAIYRDGALGGWFGMAADRVGLFKYNANSASARSDAGYDQGLKDAGTIISNLAKNSSGEIVETIKIVTHSMGGAYGKGYVRALQKYISGLSEEEQKQIKISLIADFDPYQAGDLSADPNIKTMQFIHKNNRNVLGMGWLANEIEKGMLGKDVFTNTGKSTDHSIFSFLGDISRLEEGTYIWDGNKWIRQ